MSINPKAELTGDTLYEFVIDEQVDCNILAVRQATHDYVIGTSNAPTDIELELNPYEKRAVFNEEQSSTLAPDVLDELHRAWRGSNKYTHRSETTGDLLERYWEFQEGFITWIVVESETRSRHTGAPTLRARLIRGPDRPYDYQQLLNVESKQLEDEEFKTIDAIGLEPVSEEQPREVGRIQNFGKAVTKWWKESKDKPHQPPRHNRL